MSDTTPPIVDTVIGVAHLKDQSVWIGERNINELLDSYVGLKVKLFLSHKPDEGPMPPYLWRVQKDGVLDKDGDQYSIDGTPFGLDPMIGYNSVATLVNMEFEVVPLGEMGTGSEDDITEIMNREQRLRSAIHDLSDVLGKLTESKR